MIIGLPLADSLPSSLEVFHLHIESHERDSIERSDDEITKQIFSFELLLVHIKVKTMTLRGNQTAGKVRFGALVLSQRTDVLLTVC